MKIMKLKNKRGSTLILALVLTMVLFIMGLSFISTTSIQRDMVTNSSDGQYVNGGVDVVVDRIKEVLKNDLFLSEIDNISENDGTYTGFLQGDASYDYPDRNNDWLASLTPTQIADDYNFDNKLDDYYSWPRISDLWGDFNGVDDGGKNPKRFFDTGSNDTYYWMNYHFDPDPYYLDGDGNRVVDYPDTYVMINPVGNVYNTLGWRYMVESDYNIPCRIVEDGEVISDTILARGLEADQWLSEDDISDDFEDFLYEVSTWPANSHIIDRLEVVDDSGWEDNNDDYGFDVSAPKWSTINHNYPNNGASGMRADADGDGVADSRWVRLHQVNAEGDYLYAAVRIIDNGGMINLNTAFRKPGHYSNSGVYNPYDGSYPDNVEITSSNLNEQALDNWDGSSVSHIDAWSIMRGTDVEDGYEYNIFYDFTNASFPNEEYKKDYTLALNQAACPYVIPAYDEITGYLVNAIPHRGFGGSTSSAFTYAATSPSLTDGGYYFNNFDMSEELELRNRFFLQTQNSTRLKNTWNASFGLAGSMYNPTDKYVNVGNDGNFGIFYYGNGWNWFDKTGLRLNGSPYADLRKPTGDDDDDLDQYSRRMIATTYNKDRLIRPEFYFDDPEGWDAYLGGSGYENLYENANLLSNIRDDNMYNLDTYMSGMRRCQVNARIDDNDKVDNALNGGTGEHVNDNEIDFDKDRTADFTFDPISYENIAAAYYMAIRSIEGIVYGMPEDNAQQSDFVGYSTDVNSLIRAHFGDTETALDYNCEMLAMQFKANYQDYFDVVDQTGSVPETETCVKVTGSQYYEESSSSSLSNHEEVYIGFETLDRIEEEIMCISKVAFLKQTDNPFDGTKLLGDSNPGGKVPNGSYLIVELFNPSSSGKLSSVIDDYILLITDVDGTIKTAIDFGNFNSSDPDIFSGILPTVGPVSSTTNTMAVMLYDLTTYAKYSDPNTPENSAEDYGGGNTTYLKETEDMLWDKNFEGAHSPGNTVPGPTKYVIQVESPPDSGIMVDRYEDRIFNTFHVNYDRFVYVDVSVDDGGALDSLDNGVLSPLEGVDRIDGDDKIVLVRKQVGDPADPTDDYTIAGQLEAGDVYPCDVIDLKACQDVFALYRKEKNVSSIYKDFSEWFDEESEDSRDADGHVRNFYRTDTFGTSYILLPSYNDAKYNPWIFDADYDDSSYGRHLAKALDISDVYDSEDDDEISYPDANNKLPVNKLYSAEQMYYYYRSLLDDKDEDPTTHISPLTRDVFGEADILDEYELEKMNGYNTITGLAAENFDFRQLFDRFEDWGVSTTEVVNDKRFWLSSIGQLQDIFAVGARCVEIVSSGNSYPSDSNFAISGGKGLYQPFVHSLLKARLAGSKDYYSYNGRELVGNVGKINLGDPLFERIPEFMTVIDYSRDGIDNDGDMYTDELGPFYNDDIDQDGDGYDDSGATGTYAVDYSETLLFSYYNDNDIDEDGDGKDAPGATGANAVDDDEDIFMLNLAREYEVDIYGRININTAPWYVIARLPWVTEELAQAIVAYRDKKALYGTVFDSTKYNAPNVNYEIGRAKGMWDAVSNYLGTDVEAPFTVREEPGFKSVGELINVTHALRAEYPESHASYLTDVVNTLNNSANFWGGYQETVLNDIADQVGLANGITYNNAFDIQRWAKTRRSVYAPQDPENNYVLDAQSGFEISVNNNLGFLGGTFTRNKMSAVTPFYDQEPAPVANDSESRNAIFNKISNLVTTRSDVFTAYILVRVGRDGPERRMIGIFDRGNVYSGDDEVETLALIQVPDVE